MESVKGKYRKVCERCLTITKNNKQCPNCGYSQLLAHTLEEIIKEYN
ncbi:hypothetical protein [Heyndrickxia oleronia]|uniref:Uncharacterized protein n=1 Tax=Heyndrickxia oleronia TaxID=38875 RepID=A0AAW6T6M5_9BACI|nr:hypothetical protein [Heyndrickxia oleronia]MDH5164491.1 hypothetical protein [Heyndrickxia oleronia]GIN41482.1 hypothetical protein J19TS1_44310 [Heyndrickxia oleronia]